MAGGARLFVFAGGGTGGHLYPGLAIAERLAARDAGARSVFFCSDRALDANILNREDVEFRAVPARPPGASPRVLAKFVAGWIPSVRAARGALEAAMRSAGTGAKETWVVAMGGFVSAPVVRAARGLGIRVALVNLDAVPGKANRVIARRAARIFNAAGGGMGARWVAVPPIVRRAATPQAEPEECRTRLGLDHAARVLFVTGASQGARSINGMMRVLAERTPEMFKGWQVFHQTGEQDVEEMQRAYGEAGIGAVVAPFWRRMGEAWGAADLAVARAGAGTVAEVWASGTPTIFLPYPHHKDEHQRANAAALERCGGAVVVKDLIDPERNAAEIGPVVRELMGDEARRSSMRLALRGLGPVDGADRVAAALLEA